MAEREKRYRRFHHLWAKEIDAEFFVIDDTLGRIHCLNQAGSAVWRLLEEPQSKRECVKVFVDAFPEGNEVEIEKLVDDTIAELERHGVIY